ncbi:hypothetical protein APUTEX25_005621 [Auxenochlorella protothecoides]|uniref:RING-type domain-containing protein n=1 Tax=Auxenochlorella protothecoides TaxID=3075 RepID=A0A3M7KVX0_AUXPR|nr:hypothetical protein APUTEX25_005621 [Auxenochlorella protothecoides]|eukprot:RMZ53875.1 hypothetical protein APUTEX25_005621 [Auxenochlorella protothecoides]
MTLYSDAEAQREGLLSPSRFRSRVGASLHLLQRLGLTRRLEGHTGCVNTVTFTPDGEGLLSGSDDQLIKLWDWRRGAEVLSYDSGHTDNVFQARAIPGTDNRTVVSSGADGQVRLGLAGEGGSVRTRCVARHNGRAHKLALVPGAAGWVLSCGEDGRVLSTDVQRGGPAIALGRPLPLNSVACTPLAPTQCVLGAADEVVRVFDLRMAGKPLNELRRGQLAYRGHRNAQTVKGVSFLGPDDEWVLSGSDDGHIFIWEREGGKLVALLEGDRHIVNCLAPHPTLPHVLASSGIDSDVKVWGVQAGEPAALGAAASILMARNAEEQGSRYSRSYMVSAQVTVLAEVPAPRAPLWGELEEESLDLTTPPRRQRARPPTQPRSSNPTRPRNVSSAQQAQDAALARSFQEEEEACALVRDELLFARMDALAEQEELGTTGHAPSIFPPAPEWWSPGAEQVQQASVRYDWLERVLSLLDRDFTADDYEALRALDEGLEDRRGADAASIRALPVERLSREAAAEVGRCVVCLEDVSPGTRLKRLPCGHAFHTRCIDRWLRSRGACPVCQRGIGPEELL